MLAACNSGEQQHFQLEQLEQANRDDSLMTNDSLAEELVAYFDRHGTPNEQLRAYYILGRTYADLGEAPKAIDCYQSATEYADTSMANCDFQKLSCVYSQMAEVYHEQLLLSFEIEARQKASYYAYITQDTLNAIYDKKAIAGAYILMNKADSAEAILKSVLKQYRDCGYEEEALRSSTMLMHIYVEQPDKLKEAKDLMDLYEAKSNLFDNHHELPPLKRQYYYYKGRYYEGIGQLDSAEFYYRKISSPDMDFIAMNPMYKGLLSVFQKRQHADSIAKYAQLYCEVNDSSIALNDQVLTAQLTASYRFNSIQKEAIKNAKTAKNRAIMLILLAIICIVLLLSAVYIRKRYIKRQKEKQIEIERLKAEYIHVTELLMKNRQTLMLLEESHQAAISNIQRKLEEEREYLLSKIEKMDKLDDFSELLEKSKQFFETDIIKQTIATAKNPHLKMLKTEWDELMRAFGMYFPELIDNLTTIPNISSQEIRVALLVALNCRTDDIARLLRTSGQRITNVKSDLNLSLFNEKSARTLSRNITTHYNIFVLND